MQHTFVHGGRACFWDGRNDPQRCAERVLALDALFRSKYKGYPGDIPGPACGW